MYAQDVLTQLTGQVRPPGFPANQLPDRPCKELQQNAFTNPRDALTNTQPSVWLPQANATYAECSSPSPPGGNVSLAGSSPVPARIQSPGANSPASALLPTLSPPPLPSGDSSNSKDFPWWAVATGVAVAVAGAVAAGFCWWCGCCIGGRSRRRRRYNDERKGPPKAAERQSGVRPRWWVFSPCCDDGQKQPQQQQQQQQVQLRQQLQQQESGARFADVETFACEEKLGSELSPRARAGTAEAAAPAEAARGASDRSPSADLTGEQRQLGRVSVRSFPSRRQLLPSSTQAAALNDEEEAEQDGAQAQAGESLLEGGMVPRPSEVLPSAYARRSLSPLPSRLTLLESAAYQQQPRDSSTSSRPGSILKASGSFKASAMSDADSLERSNRSTRRSPIGDSSPGTPTGSKALAKHRRVSWVAPEYAAAIEAALRAVPKVAADDADASLAHLAVVTPAGDEDEDTGYPTFSLHGPDAAPGLAAAASLPGQNEDELFLEGSGQAEPRGLSGAGTPAAAWPRGLLFVRSTSTRLAAAASSQHPAPSRRKSASSLLMTGRGSAEVPDGLGNSGPLPRFSRRPSCRVAPADYDALQQGLPSRRRSSSAEPSDVPQQPQVDRWTSGTAAAAVVKPLGPRDAKDVVLDGGFLDDHTLQQRVQKIVKVVKDAYSLPTQSHIMGQAHRASDGYIPQQVSFRGAPGASAEAFLLPAEQPAMRQAYRASDGYIPQQAPFLNARPAAVATTSAAATSGRAGGQWRGSPLSRSFKQLSTGFSQAPSPAFERPSVASSRLSWVSNPTVQEGEASPFVGASTSQEPPPPLSQQQRGPDPVPLFTARSPPHDAAAGASGTPAGSARSPLRGGSAGQLPLLALAKRARSVSHLGLAVAEAASHTRPIWRPSTAGRNRVLPQGPQDASDRQSHSGASGADGAQGDEHTVQASGNSLSQMLHATKSLPARRHTGFPLPLHGFSAGEGSEGGRQPQNPM